MTLWTLRNVCTRGPLLGCLLVVGCASSPTVINERHLERSTVRLEHQTDADSLAAAGLFQVIKNRAQAVALLARAEAAAPGRADLVWLHLQACQRELSCDSRPEEEKLRTLDPTNGAGWLSDLARAVKAKDDGVADAALTAIAHTERVDIYWTTLIAHLSMAAARTGSLSPAEAMLTVTGMVAAVGIPAYAPASHYCQGDHLQRHDMREACRGVARAFQNGDTAITEMMGVAIAKRVWLEGSTEWTAAVERRRVFEYRTQLWTPLEPVAWRGAEAQKYIALCLENPREQAVIRAQLMDAGKDPDPPTI